MTTKLKRSFPRTCVKCRQVRVMPATIDREMTLKYDGAHYQLFVRSISVNKCEHCNECTFGDDSDSAINAALRAHLGLLAPSDIRSHRKALGLTQESLAAALGCANETISRWESDWIVQSAAYDRLLRAYFALPELRAFLAALGGKGSQDLLSG